MSKLNEHVLVLDKTFLAVQVWTARDAIGALCSARARVVDLNYSWYDLKAWIDESKRIKNTELHLYPGTIRSPSIELVIPQVIQITNDKRIPQRNNVKFSRKNVMQRDNLTCQYCGHKFSKKELTLDHILPRSRGGKSHWSNIVTCCKNCNETKGNKSIIELGWSLIQKPIRPKWKSHVGTTFKRTQKEYWIRFLG